jgi:hypothetical protein
VLSFNAETNDAGPLRFLGVGITGGFLGTYRTIKFHEQIRDYEALDDRDLWILRLQMSEDEKRSLHDAVQEAKGQWYPYTYFSKNCAYYIQKLLSQALPRLPEPSGIVSPIEVFELMIMKGYAVDCYYRVALSSQLVERSQMLSMKTIEKIRKLGWRQLASDLDWLQDLPAQERYFMQAYFNMKALHCDDPLDQRTQAGMSLIRTMNASEAVSPEHAGPEASPGRRIAMPDIHAYGRMTASTRIRRDHDARIELCYRPALHDFNDPWLGHRPLNVLEMFSLTVSGSAGRYRPRFEEFSLYSQYSLPPLNDIAARCSWMLDLSARRGGLYGENGISAGIESGWGRTRSLADSAYGYCLVTGAILGSPHHKLALAPGVRAGVGILITEKWRCGAHWDRHRDIFEWPRSFGSGDVWIHRDVDRDWALTIHAIADNSDQEIKLDVNWYH